MSSSSADQSEPERALRESAERYRAFVANSSEGIWRCELSQPIPVDVTPDKFLNLVYEHAFLAEANEAMARMYGYDTPEQIVGTRLDQLLVRTDPANEAYLRAFFASGFRLIDAESHEVDKEGHDKYFLNNLIGVVEDGRLLRAWGTQRDITDRKRIEDQLRGTVDEARHARDAAEAANRAKTQFLGVLSHELRTPLTPILLMVTMLQQRQDLPADVREDMTMIRENIETEARLIDDLLDMSRITRGKLKLDMGEVDLNDIVAAAVREAKSEDSAPMTVESTAHSMRVAGDPARLQQILRSLLSNAVKFTPRKGRIMVRTRNPRPDQIAIDVVDTGIGIEKDQFHRIFHLFEAGDQSTRRRHGGLGLGLSISSWLAEAHRGTLTVASEGKDRGSTFTLTLPLSGNNRP